MKFVVGFVIGYLLSESVVTMSAKQRVIQRLSV